ncbi:MAG: DUF3990 domain-containing protein [Candidatus Methanomethylophilaceae archaeon]|nr:DUF3990 domain-containing protein [Candidatus Methanomethylophilaceae archaeon]
MFKKGVPTNMRLYHGSDQIIDVPKIIKPNRKTDFGSGFYTTWSEKQAESWSKIVCKRRGSEQAYVSEYEYSENSECTVLLFDGPTAEWFDFIISNRKGESNHEYDIVIGPVADDSVYETLFRFEIGDIDREEAILKLKTAKLDGQVLFHTDKSLNCIKYIGYKEVR